MVEENRTPGSHDPNNLDPHSLPARWRSRCICAAIRGEAIELAAEVSRTTQQSPIVLELCRLWAALLLDALAGAPKAQLARGQRAGGAAAAQRPLKTPVKELIEQAATRSPRAPTRCRRLRAALVAFAKRQRRFATHCCAVATSRARRPLRRSVRRACGSPLRRGCDSRGVAPAARRGRRRCVRSRASLPN